mmetsp:Transcript_18265/g.16154  ORF Transcript_18265/g.16154 Transcript_18265/m.16154 type:complete len:286 (+) Transcript_18265:130-987(+)
MNKTKENKLLKNDLSKLLEINKSLQCEIMKLRNTQSHGDIKLFDYCKDQIKTLKSKLKEAYDIASKKEITLRKLKNEYSQLESDFIRYKSHFGDNIIDKKYENVVRDNKKLLDLIKTLRDENKFDEENKQNNIMAIDNLSSQRYKHQKEIKRLNNLLESSSFSNNYKDLRTVNHNLRGENNELKSKLRSSESQWSNQGISKSYDTRVKDSLSEYKHYKSSHFNDITNHINNVNHTTFGEINNISSQSPSFKDQKDGFISPNSNRIIDKNIDKVKDKLEDIIQRYK